MWQLIIWELLCKHFVFSSKTVKTRRHSMERIPPLPRLKIGTVSLPASSGYIGLDFLALCRKWFSQIHFHFSQQLTTALSTGGVARIWCERGNTKLHENYLSHIMTRNHTINKVHVAATELQQLLKQNTNIFGEETAQNPLSNVVRL